jgi:hypothetical protein
VVAAVRAGQAGPRAQILSHLAGCAGGLQRPGARQARWVAVIAGVCQRIGEEQLDWAALRALVLIEESARGAGRALGQAVPCAFQAGGVAQHTDSISVEVANGGTRCQALVG